MYDHVELVGITGVIIDAGISIHKDLGPGMLESVYEQILQHELQARGLRVRRQVDVRFSYKGVDLSDGFRVDLLVENAVVVELKAVARLERVFARQVLTYLRILNLRAGLLMNFGAPLLKEGLHRVVNGRPRSHYLHANVHSSGRPGHTEV